MFGLILFALTTPVLGIIFAHNEKLKKWLIPFGAGLLLATVLTHLIPEIMQSNSAHTAGWTMVAGFVMYFVLSSWITMCPHDEHNCTNDNHKGVSKLLILGFVIHAILDGIAINTLSTAGIRDALIGLSVHRAIDGIALVALAHTHNMNKKTIYEWFAYIMAATCMGYAIGNVNLNVPHELMTAFVCGTLVYILAADMIPETHKNNTRITNIVSMTAGLLLAYTLTNFTTHVH